MTPTPLPPLTPLTPVTLTGEHVQLIPLSHAHHDALIPAASDGELWRLWYTAIPSPQTMRSEIDRRLALQAEGSMLPFTVIDRTTNQPVGMTTYVRIDLPTRRVEIGHTWYARRVQRTPLNTEAKLLLLTHAFDTLGCMTVQLRTHFMNHQSRRAIERLGAKLDGVLRNYDLLPNGTLRDTCVYSILANEWPAVRSHLTWQLEKPR